MDTPEKTAPGEPRPAVEHIEAGSLHEHESEAIASIDPSPDCGVEISGGRAAGNAVQDIQDLLGEGAVLLPIRRGEKGPLLQGWQNTTIEVMQDASYRERLARGNIGVLLGRPSGGLCAIDIDSDAGVEPFLELNPLLRDTLISKGSRGVQIWVRIAGEYPALTKVKTEAGADWGEWRGHGSQSVIYGQHPHGMEYRRVNNVSPITVAFDEINWPEDLKLPWLKDASDLLTEEHGPAYAVKPGLQTNDYFFAARYHPIAGARGDPRRFFECQLGMWGGASSPENVEEQLQKHPAPPDLTGAAR